MWNPGSPMRLDMDENAVRAIIEDHFEASTDDIVRASEIYADEAVLEFPQGRERIRGKADIMAFRSACPARSIRCRGAQPSGSTSSSGSNVPPDSDMPSSTPGAPSGCVEPPSED
jgi:hypothetical protein